MSASSLAEATALDRLPGVGLGELADQAPLMSRTERKYVVATSSLPGILAALEALDPGLRVLEIDGVRRHRYDSTYLDTPELEAYWRAARRRRRRFKVRTRHYVDSGAAYTEVKTRGPRGSTVKTRLPRAGDPDADRHPLAGADLVFVDTELDDAGLAHVDVAALVPVLRSTYVRSTLWLPDGHARVTVDVDVSWHLPWDGAAVRVPGLAVVETKTAGGRARVDRALWALGHRPLRLSKYATGLALLLPDLPAHRWHRVLTRHLQPHLDRTPTPRTQEIA